MDRPKAHEIDTKAQKVFKSALPDAWIVQDLTSDYGIDHQIELAVDQIVTGPLVGVQLKGTRSLKSGKDHVTRSVPTKNLIYYADDATIPVFLVVVDTTKGVGYWCFLQEHMQEKLKGCDWRSKKSATIRIPKENQLTDHDRLAQAIRHADEFMKSYRPGAIGPSIRAEEERLESLDPRFTVQISASKDTQNVDIRAKRDTEFKVHFKGADACRKADDLVNKGLPVEFSPGEVQVTGSPLFEKINADVVQMQSKRTWDVDVELIALGKNGECCSPPIRFDGQLEGGCTELRFSGGVRMAPLVLAFTMHIGAEKQSSECTLSYDYRRWVGQRLTQLAYFEQFDQLVTSVSKGAALRVHGSHLGCGFMDAEIDPVGFQLLPLMRLVPILKKARHIAAVAGVNPILPPIFRRQDAAQICDLYELMTRGHYRQPGASVRMRFGVSREDFERLLRHADPAKWSDEPVVMDLGCEKWDFFGENVARLVETTVRKLTYPRLEESVDELAKQLQVNESEAFHFTIVGTENSELITEAPKYKKTSQVAVATE